MKIVNSNIDLMKDGKLNIRFGKKRVYYLRFVACIWVLFSFGYIVVFYITNTAYRLLQEQNLNRFDIRYLRAFVKL